MDIIFKEIGEENKEIRKTKEYVQNDKGKKNIQTRIEVGKLVEKALAEKKEKEAESIAAILKKAAYEYKLNRTIGDQMFMNAAFLVDKGREKEFDNIMDDLSQEHKDSRAVICQEKISKILGVSRDKKSMKQKWSNSFICLDSRSFNLGAIKPKNFN
jgi:hypothetical protein